MKLKEPVDNPHKAFCTRGCHSSFHLNRCLVCEKAKPRQSAKFCRRPKCKSDYARNQVLFDFRGGSSQIAREALESAHYTGVKTGDFDARPWRIVAGPKITATAFQFATLTPDAETIRRYNAANDWDRIKRETAWGGKAA